MPDIHTTMPKLPFTYAQWIQQTSKTMLRRSAKLKALDIMIDAYNRTPSGNNLQFLKNAFRNWRESKGESEAWMQSKRNDNSALAFVALNAVLHKDGDKDTSLGTPSFMQDDLVNSRRGLLYLFGHLECSVDYFKIVTGGVLDIAGAGMDYASEQVGDSAKETIGSVKEGMGFIRPDIDSMANKLDNRRTNRSGQKSLPSGSIDLKTSAYEVERRRIVDASLLLSVRPDRLTPNQQTTSNAIYEQLQNSWKNVVGYWDESGGGDLRMLCDFLTGKYLSEAITGTIGGSFGAAGNLIKLIKSSFERYNVWVSGKKTTVLMGTPTSIVNGIKRAMEIAIGQDLYQTLKSGAQLGMQITSAGASTIINLVTSIIEILVKTAWRVFEIRRLRKFLAEAKLKWQHHKVSQLHTKPLAFNAWFSHHALHTPIISALALNSNICHNMHFLQMFPVGKEPIKQAQYDAGMTHMGFLKDWSSQYIENSNYNLTSDDGLVEEWIKPGKRADQSSLQKHLISPVVSFLGGG